MRLLAYLQKHPMCCFCGGNEFAVERDHLPPRSVFYDNKAPDGYVFPACERCNRGSSEDDAIFALMSRLFDLNEDRHDPQDSTRKLIAAFAERHPGEIEKMRLSASERRRAAKQLDLKVRPGMALGELPLIQVTPRIRQAMDTVSRKLILALHYRHGGRIVPADAGLWVRWYPNTTPRFLTDDELDELAPGIPDLRWQKALLHEQFTYRYGTGAGGNLGMYVAMFRGSFIVVGMLSFDRMAIPEMFVNETTDAAWRKTRA